MSTYHQSEFLLQQDRFRKLKWFPSSVAFGGARVPENGPIGSQVLRFVLLSDGYAQDNRGQLDRCN